MDSTISGDACSHTAHDSISTYPFARTFANPGVGACPLTFAGHSTVCRQQHLGGALVGRDSRSMTTRFRGTPMHEVSTEYRTPGSHLHAFPSSSIGNDTLMHQVDLGDRRRLTVQQPWGYTHMNHAAEPVALRPTDTRSVNFSTNVLGV